MCLSVIKLNNVSFSYNGTDVLENINLEVKKGDYLAVIGPNGGGKTTLLKLILGLLKPQKGSITLFDDLPEKAARRIGYVPQQLTIKQGFPITVLDVVLMGLTDKSRFGWGYSSLEKENAYKSLAYVDMKDFGAKRISELSGGQKQRVFLARALVSDPELLILDEPTSSIDPHGTFCFYTFLEKLSKSITIIVVSHNLNLLASDIYSIACVNKNLIHSPQATLTKEMMSLMYGTHDEHSCSVGLYLAEEADHMSKYHARRS